MKKSQMYLCLLTALFLFLSTDSFCRQERTVVTRMAAPARLPIHWDNSLCLPAVANIPNIGVSGAFSGIIGNELIIIGGSNFPDAVPWRGGHKTYYRRLYTLPLNGSTHWKVQDDFFPEALGYGISIQLPEGVLCIGGCDTQKCSEKVYLIHLSGTKLIVTSWPSLPFPLANATGALVGSKIFVAGGQERMDSQVATHHFFVLDLKHKERGWRELQSWPGANRGYAVSASQLYQGERCFFLFSGRDYTADGKMTVLNDAFVYLPKQGRWTRLQNSFPVMAATAIPVGNQGIALLGGVPALIPGSDTHPGFDNSVRLYNIRTGKLSTIATSPYPIAVTTNAVLSGRTFYITSGEIKPGIRTLHILKGTLTGNLVRRLR